MGPTSSTLLEIVKWLRNAFLRCHRISGDEEQDRISDLPDEILSYVISFLSTKDAVQTSLSSRRWINVWRFITNLNFDEGSFINTELLGKCNNLSNFVREIHSPIIQSFTLSGVSGNLPEALVSSWISSVLERQVEKLDIEFLCECFNFPSTLFKCNTLTEINLRLRHCFLDFHTPLHNPNLQILLLTGVEFKNFSSSSEVLLDFPLVKVFKLKECTFLNVQKLIINIPRVKRFVFKQSKDNSKLICYSIELCAPSLIKSTLTLISSPFPKFVPPNPSSIQKALIETVIPLHLMKHPQFNQDFMHSSVCEHLKSIQAVKYLKLDVNVIWVLKCRSHFTACLPIFDNLVHLEVESSEIKLKVLLKILHKTPLLESLICRTSAPLWEEYVSSQVPVPQCITYHLKKLTIKEFQDKEGDFHHAEYFLKNARILEQMKITIFQWGHRKTIMEKVKERLSKCAKASSHAEIYLVCSKLELWI